MNKFYLLFLCLISLISVLAQTASGVITDENGDPLYGVNVVEKGTVNGTTTDFDGKYSLKFTKENPILQFKYIGYRNYEVEYKGSPINYKMELDAIGVDAVVVSASKRKERVLDAPASVTILNAEKIENTAAVVATDNLKGVPGVDIMPTGLVSQNVTSRGFNNIFSGSLLVLVDNRIARVPSLKVNAFQLMPTNNDDIKKIEIVRGPGSALYGPNASDGVMHLITKSPLDMGSDHNAETTISLTGGTRSVLAPDFRHSQKITDKIGFKISGGYMQGHDFEYYDPREPTWGNQFYYGTVQDGVKFVVDSSRGIQDAGRNFFIRKYNVDGRFDFAITKDIDITLNGGYANTANIELTGLGAAQSEGWGYAYGQFKFRWKKLFVQYYINASNSGNTFLIPQVEQGDPQPYNYQTLVDKSKLHGIQIQHSASIKDKWDFTYGFDAFLTRPLSEGTIYGRYENDDNINQFGIYGQAEWHVIKQLDILGAIRVDYQDRIKEWMFSPRGAIVYKPSLRHTLRFTYNRAFSSPSALITALDLPSTFIPNGIIGRGLGNPDGFSYNYGSDGKPMFMNPYTNTWGSVDDKSNNLSLFNGLTQVIGESLGRALLGSEGGDLGKSLMEALTSGLTDPGSPVENVDLITTDFITNQKVDLNTISDLESVKSTVTQTFELGYKGIIKDRLFLSTDFYFSMIKNFISPLTSASYRVQFDPNQISGAIAPAIYANLQNVSTTIPGGYTYDQLLSGAFTPSLNLDANNNGTVYEEVMGLLAGDPSDPSNNGYLYDISAGTVAPEGDLYGSDLILTYLNLGKVNIFGSDIGATYLQDIKKMKMSISGMFSFVNKNKIAVPGATDGYIALNAPKFKSSLAFEMSNIADIGLGAGVNWRWQDAFPANSAIYVGNVNAANLIDMSLSYRPNFSKNTLLTANFYNIANYKFQRFPGTPAIGFYALFKVSHTFKYNIGKKRKNENKQ